MPCPEDVRFPDVPVRLSGHDGNVYAVIGRVSEGLKRAGYPEAAAEWTADARSQPTYDKVLQCAMRWVDVS